jgi:hypothetical protein
MRTDRTKFAAQTLTVSAVVLLVSTLAMPHPARAGSGSDPNLFDRIDQFIWKPSPDDLLLPPGHDDGGKSTDKKPKPGKK